MKKNKKIIAPSILSADFFNLQQQIRYIEIGGADWIHCDIMDGQFVPNLTFGSMVIKSLKKNSNLPLDVHLMIEKPENLVDDFISAGADFITVHQEAVVHLHRLIQYIKSKNVFAGVSINPSTPLCSLENILEYVDMILIMSVNPGFGGQEFISSSIQKIANLSEIREKKGLDFYIQVDGGISKNNIKSISEAGCNVFVAGSSIFHSDNISASTAELKNIVN
ncbi:MAG: ribulose-phosphate 3-epimerase [Ignavibacteriales bacterium]|nr:ribulose-phosphate 3-epimerase [Ignavibacteriales bacterium]